jgi:hypothetical protein
MPLGYTDNSNISDEDVLNAKTSLPAAKAYVKRLQFQIKALRAKIAGRSGGKVWSNFIGDDYQSSPQFDLVAPNRVTPTAKNAPFKYTFNAAEYENYAGYVDPNPGLLNESKGPSFVWVMKYLPTYSDYYKPNPASRTGQYRSDYNKYFYAATVTDIPFAERRTGVAGLFMLNDKQAEYWQIQDELNKKLYSLTLAKRKVQQYEDTIETGPDISLFNSDGTQNQRAFIDLVYNVGSVKEAYFSERKDFLEMLTTFDKVNSPAAVTNASQLWVNGKNNKGMIQPDSTLATQNLAMPEEVKLPSVDPEASVITKRFDPTGFQFLYNPASVNMRYNGILGVDPNMQTNGLDQFNPLGTYTQATVDFNILVNRMFDFKYYDQKTGVIAEQYKNDNIYYPRQPEISEQKDIYKKGTMYDIEHLLRAVLGFGMPSYLGRNMADGKTADLGFITGIPVELHLGSNLRYLGNVTSLVVSHVLFDERMVPIFTNLSISFARLIDPVRTEN